MRSITGGRTWLAGLLILPSLAGFLFLDAGVGMILGVATAATILLVAARSKVDEPVDVADPGPGVPGGLFVLAVDPIDDVRTAAIIAASAKASRSEAQADVLVVSPARSGILARWTDDVEGARAESERRLSVSLAALAAAGVGSEGRVGDGDPLRAAEDALRSFAAAGVVVVASPGPYEREIGELERRLDRSFRRIDPTPS